MLRLLLVILLVPTAAAVAEADAHLVDDRVEAVWHAPDEPQPGTQWTGGLRLAPDTNVTQVLYQICRVGEACFAPPTPANSADGRNWTFDTNDYRDPVQGMLIAWGINLPHQHDTTWEVGVQYFLRTPNNTAGDPVPRGIEELPPRDCVDACWDEWSATHYFVFTMPATSAGQETTPAPGIPILLVLLAVGARNVAIKSRRAMQE